MVMDGWRDGSPYTDILHFRASIRRFGAWPSVAFTYRLLCEWRD